MALTPVCACPVCGATSAVGRELAPAYLRQALADFVGEPVPDSVPIEPYSMHRCVGCELEFAEPMAPAKDAFYGWLDRHGTYYIKERWEWTEVTSLIAATAQKAEPLSILEIGAGDAYFLGEMRRRFGARTVAIERSQAAVQALRARGVEAYAQDDVASALAGQHFDFVLAFHCLEHVPNPLAFARSMRAFAGPHGRVLFSVPYSPMYFEHAWFDPLNHPPHHLTRWNRQALEALAAHSGARARLTLPLPYVALNRARYTLAVHYLGRRWYLRPRRWRVLPLLHPLHFLAEWRRQHQRERINGRAAADVVLVELLTSS